MRQSPPYRAQKSPRPVDPAGLEALALRYVGRYATTRAKLATYLHRKIGERGWSGDGPVPVEALCDRFAGLGYVDDRAFADAKAASLGRRGFGVRRVGDALRAAGVGEDDRAEAEAAARSGAWEAAIALARRRRIGPFAAVPPDRAGRERAIAILVRAGHDVAMARKVVEMSPDLAETADFNL